MADRPRRCPLHGEPLGPPPARNCPACRAAIDSSLASGRAKVKMQTTSRVTGPQWELLAEIAVGRGLYIRRGSRYERTVEALRARGLVEIDEHDHSRHGQDHYIVTIGGRRRLEGKVP